MSQIKHRQRLHDRRAAEQTGGISAFQGQANIGRIAPVANRTGGADQGPGQEAPKPAVDATQARTTAEMLAVLPPEEYQASLAELQANSPAFYEAVVAELNAMNEQTTEGEGDGFDLSGVQDAVQQGGGLPAPAPSPQQIAQELATVDEQEYKDRLTQLETDNPALYASVVDELTKMNQQ